MTNRFKNCRQKTLLLISTILILASCRGGAVQDQSNNPYGLDIISTLESYTKSIEADSSSILVDLEKYIPNIVIDIRYATSNNFTGTAIYTSPRAWLRKEAADSLLKVQKELNEQGLGIKVFDAYRPYAATLYFYEVYGDTTFVAAPWRGSIHNRGGAIDLTLINLSSGEELEMPTPFDDFTPMASHDYTDLSAGVLYNRQLLADIMIKYGFTIYSPEWWHYNLKDQKKYSLMDLSFEDLDKFGT